MSDDYTDQQTAFDPAMERLLNDAGIDGGGILPGILGAVGIDNTDSRGLLETKSEEVLYDLTGNHTAEHTIGKIVAELADEFDRDPNSEGGRKYQELVTYVRDNPPSTSGAIRDWFTDNNANGATAGVMTTIGSYGNGAQQTALAFSFAGVEPEQIEQVQQALEQNPAAMEAIEAAVSGMTGEGGDLDLANLANNKELFQQLAQRPQEFSQLVAALGPGGTTALLNTGAGGEGMSPEQTQQVVNMALDHPQTVGAVLQSDVFQGLTQNGLSLNPETIGQSLEQAPLEQKIDLLYDVAVAQNPALGAGREEFQQKLQSAIEQQPELENDLNEMVSGMSDGMGGGDLGQTLESLEQIAPQFATFASSDMADNLLSNPDAMHNALNFGELNFDQKLGTAYAIVAPEADTSALNSMLENNPEVRGKLETVMNSLIGGEEGGTPDLQNLAGTLNAAEPILTAAAQNPEKIETLLNNVDTEDLTVLINSMGGMEGGDDPSMGGNFLQMALDNPEIVGSLLSSEAFDNIAEDGEIDFNNLAGELEDVSLDSKVDLLFDLAASAIIGDGPEADAERAKLLEDKERVSEQLNTAMEKNPELEGLINTELAGKINSAMIGGGEGGSGDMLADLGANAQQFASFLSSQPFETMLTQDHLTKAAIRYAQTEGENGQPVGIMSAGTEVFMINGMGNMFGRNPDRFGTVGLLNTFGGTEGLADMITGAFGQGNNADGNMLSGLFSSFLGGSEEGGSIMGMGDASLAQKGMTKLQEMGLLHGIEISRARTELGIEAPTPQAANTDQLFQSIDAQMNDQRFTAEQLRMAPEEQFAANYNFMHAYNQDGTPKEDYEMPDWVMGTPPTPPAAEEPTDWATPPQHPADWNPGVPMG